MIDQLLEFLRDFSIKRGKRNDNEEDLLLATLEHAKRGYATAQETIKFLDTKTNIVTGLSSLFSAFLLAWGKWSIESQTLSPINLIQVAKSSKAHAWFLGALFLINLSATFLCMLCAIWTVIARSRPHNLNEKFLVLFPQYTSSQEVEACREFERKLKGMSTRECLREYEDQLRIVGMILGKKLSAHRRASIALIVQFATIVLAAFALAFASLLS
jgi:hypothetical protein